MKAGLASSSPGAGQMTAWHKALAASLGLHGLIFGLLLRPGDPGPTPLSSVAPPMQVVVVARNPQRVPSPVATADNHSGNAPATNLAEAGLSALPPATSAAGSQETTAVSSAAEAPAAAATAGAETEQGSDMPALQLSPAVVRQAISTFAGGYRRELATTWLEGCLIEQKQRGKQDCSRQRSATAESPAMQVARTLAQGAFASVTRPQQQFRLSREFLRSANELLPPLLAKGGLLGEMATFRAHMSREYYAYLNGNANPGTAAFVVANMPGQLNIAGSGYLQPLCNPMPCVWNYTGFEVAPPEPALAEVPFPVKTTLFGSRR